VKAINPSGEEIEITEIVATQPVPEAATPSSLPKTGSSLPLVALVGVLALGLALSLRVAVVRMT